MRRPVAFSVAVFAVVITGCDQDSVAVSAYPNRVGVITWEDVDEWSRPSVSDAEAEHMKAELASIAYPTTLKEAASHIGLQKRGPMWAPLPSARRQLRFGGLLSNSYDFFYIVDLDVPRGEPDVMGIDITVNEKRRSYRTKGRQPADRIGRGR
jgi:hypothetical protein